MQSFGLITTFLFNPVFASTLLASIHYHAISPSWPLHLPEIRNERRARTCALTRHYNPRQMHLLSCRLPDNLPRPISLGHRMELPGDNVRYDMGVSAPQCSMAKRKELAAIEAPDLLDVPRSPCARGDDHVGVQAMARCCHDNGDRE